MSVAELNEEVLRQLAAGDVVGSQESAKEHVATLVALIEEPYDGARTQEDLREDMLARWDTPSIELLAVLFPVVEYDDERAISVLSRCMHRIASATSLMTEERGWNRQCGVIALGRLVWAVTAYALHCRRLDALAELSRVSIRLQYGGRPVEPLIGMRDLRYPDLGSELGPSPVTHQLWRTSKSKPDRFVVSTGKSAGFARRRLQVLVVCRYLSRGSKLASVYIMHRYARPQGGLP